MKRFIDRLAVALVIVAAVLFLAALALFPGQSRSPDSVKSETLHGTHWLPEILPSNAKVGDRIRVTSGHFPPAGATGTVVAVDAEDNQVRVAWDRGTVNGFTHQWIGIPSVPFEIASGDGWRPAGAPAN